MYGIKHGDNVLITPPVTFHFCRGGIVVGNNVSISASSVFLGVKPSARIVMGDNIRIAHHFQISCASLVDIKSNVNIAPFVFISDHNHKFEDPDIPIKDQGICIQENASVVIGDGSWIGTKVTIVGNVNIGKHCIIGANSVVTRDIPDYSVAVGAPARVIRHYDSESGQWARC